MRCGVGEDEAYLHCPAEAAGYASFICRHEHVEEDLPVCAYHLSDDVPLRCSPCDQRGHATQTRMFASRRFHEAATAP